MRAELQSLLTVGGADLDTVHPNDEAFRVGLRAIIGPAGAQGEESFDFDMCSPAWLLEEARRHAIVSGRFLLIATDYQPKLIEAYVLKRIAQASGDDWSTIAGKIARWSQWEFEDYQEQ
jgi:Immunity protein 8